MSSRYETSPRPGDPRKDETKDQAPQSGIFHEMIIVNGRTVMLDHLVGNITLEIIEASMNEATQIMNRSDKNLGPIIIISDWHKVTNAKEAFLASARVHGYDDYFNNSQKGELYLCFSPQQRMISALTSIFGRNKVTGVFSTVEEAMAQVKPWVPKVKSQE